MYRLLNQHITSKAIVIACEIALDKKLTEGAMTVIELAKQCDFSPAATRRLMRVLAANNIVSLKNDVINATPLCLALEQFRSPHILQGHAIVDRLNYSLKSNHECYSSVFGESFYDSVAKNPNMQTAHNQWADCSAKNWLIPTILANYDFSEYSSICEIGKWNHLTQHLQQNFEGKHCYHIKEIERSAEELPLVECDAYVICRSMLNFENDYAIELLTQLRKKALSRSKIIVIDYFIPDENHPDYLTTTLADINVLVTLGGALRTRVEWYSLMEKARLNVNQFIVTDSDTSCVEAVIPLFILEATAV